MLYLSSEPPHSSSSLIDTSWLPTGGSDPAEIALADGEDNNSAPAAVADRRQEAEVPRSDVLPLLLALEENDMTAGLGRQVPKLLKMMSDF